MFWTSQRMYVSITQSKTQSLTGPQLCQKKVGDPCGETSPDSQVLCLLTSSSQSLWLRQRPRSRPREGDNQNQGRKVVYTKSY